MNRRRAMTLIGAATAGCFPSCRRPSEVRSFSDIAFGTEVGFKVHGMTGAGFERLTKESVGRLRELESWFSLYDSGSLISKLNRDGFVEAPEKFTRLVREALAVGERTGGVFDITVQPLWNWRQAWKNADMAERRRLKGSTWKQALELVDYRKVSVSNRRVEFAMLGMAITLNGIVQGHATDEILALIRKHGGGHALVNIGEYAALGHGPDGDPWPVELAASGETVELASGRALAVSAGSGYTFDPDGRFHHIFRPSDGTNPRPHSTVVVTAPTATLADALATALAAASEDERGRILKEYPAAQLREIR
jgi:thiamine biosynthesis lipoprotein